MIVARYNVFHKIIIGCAFASMLSSCALSDTATDDVNNTLELTQVSAAAAQEMKIRLRALLPATVTPYYLDTLSTLYAANNMKPMWQDKQAVKEFEQQLAEVALAGFQPQFSQWVNSLTNPEITDMARDIILSDAMVGYLNYLEGVEANGERWLYRKGTHKLDIPSTTSLAQWQFAAKNNSQLNKYLLSLAPQQAGYAEMRKAMLTFLNDDTVWPHMKFTKSIRVGNAISAQDVATLTLVLNHMASWSGDELLKVSQDELQAKKYSQSLAESVKEFQTLHGLANDGSIGKQTVFWLNKTPQERAALMALNIQRLRLLPAKIETNILVNIPDFSLVYYVDGKETLTSRVIVGRPARKTPLMKNALTNVVINPPWNVPTKLIREDIVPKIKRDPNYLKRQGYKVYSGWDKGATVVDASEVNWSEMSAKDVNFRFEQSPGGGNALGRYKFNMPNSEAIYLHDTPNHRLFNNSSRAISSGCVRVNQASKLASLLLNEVDSWDDAKISSTLKRGSTTHVNLSQRVPVQLYYLTAWVSSSKYPQFRNDIYGYDVITSQSFDNIMKIKMLVNR